MLKEWIGDKGLSSTVLDQFSDCVIVTDTELEAEDGPRILFVNGALCELTGYDRSELVGKSNRIFHGTDTDPAALDRIVQSLQAGRTTREELLNHRKDGSPFWIEVEASPLRNEDGETVAFTWVQRVITKRKTAQIERDATEMWAAAGERIANIGTWGYDVLENRTYWSDGMFRLFERDKDRGPPANEDVLPLVHEDHRGIMSDAMLRAIKHGRSFEIEVRCTTETGIPKWIRMHGEPLLQDNGRTRAVVGATRDVTREREVTARLSDAISVNETLEKNFSTARAIAKIGAFDYSVKDDLQHWTDELFEMTGLSKEVVPAEADSFISRIDPADRDEFDRLFNDAIVHGRGYETRVRFHRPDGKDMVMQIVADVEDTEDDRRIVGIARDVTEEVKASEQLRKQEERFRLIADAVSDVLWDYDIENGTWWATPSWPEKLGVTLEDADVPPDQWTRFIAENDQPRYIQSMVNAMRSGAEMWRDETTITGTNGVTVNVQVNAKLLRREDNRVYRALGNLRNIDREKHLNELLARARGLESLAQMTGGIAHDFNNLLMIILGNAEILEFAELAEEDRQAVELIGRAATSAASLTQRLLEFSGRKRLTTSVINMPDFFTDLLPLIQSALTNRIAVALDLGKDIWAVEADKTALEQSILNLALNARDAMPDGGKLSISCENKLVNEEMMGSQRELGPGRYLRISVADDGEGMDEGVLARAREPYFTTKDVGKGTGLGLSSAYGFARQSGGTLEVISKVGLGTTIHLYLPASVMASGEAAVAEPQSGGGIGQGRSVLLVEDQPEIRSHLGRMLSRLEFSVTSTADARAALERLEEGDNFDLLFTDIVMPGGMNGVELAKKAQEVAPNLKVLFTSGFAGAAFEDAGLSDEHAVPILKKPYRATELSRALEDVFSER